MKKYGMGVVLLSTLILSGCGSKVVNIVQKKDVLTHVCIENNPSVKVTDFLPVIEKVFNEWGISTETYNESKKPNYCSVNMTYTAKKSWDVTPYLSYASASLYKNSHRIGYVEYKLNGGSMSLDMSKWAKTESKMRPILEELLSQQDKKKMIPHPKNITKAANKTSNLDEKFKRLKTLHSDGLITDEEYNNKRKQLLKNY